MYFSANLCAFAFNHFVSLSLVALLVQNATAEPKVEESVIGRSSEGRPIHCRVYGDGPDALMVIATIHGNEGAGTPLVEAFGEWLESHPDELAGRQVVIIPVANPDGMAAGVRFNPRGIDLNRNFPAGNWQDGDVNLHGETPLSEPESRSVLRAIMQYFPHRIVSIHQPLECIDYDGPAKELAEAMGKSSPLPVKKLGGLPGSLGSFVGETLKKPIITLELPKETSDDPAELWKQYGESLVAALRFADANKGQ
jgi:murein peptide amidase A